MRAGVADLARLIALTATVAGAGLGVLGAAPAAAAPTCPAPGAVNARAETPRDITPLCPGAQGLAIVRGAIHGVATVDRGTLTYTSNPGFTGTDTFVYAPTGDGGAGGPVTQVVHVAAGANSPPICSPATTHTRVGETPKIDLTCQDPDRDLLKYTVASSPTQGFLIGLGRAADGTVSLAFEPKGSFAGEDAFSMKVNDGHGGSVTEVERVHVSSLLENGAPTCTGPTTLSAASGLPSTYTGTCTDRDGDTATSRLVARPAHGTVSPGTNGALVYTPTAGYTGPDSFTWDATDGHNGTSQPTTVAVTVGAEHAPSCTSSSASTPRGQGVAFHFTCTDADHNPLTFTKTSGPAVGTVTGSGADWTYHAQGSFSGRDRIAFTASDGARTTAGSVTIYVTGPGTVNEAPACSSGFVPVPENSTAVVSFACADANGDPFTVSIVSGPRHGTLTGTGPSRIYTPAPGYTGKDSMTIQATDGTLTSDVEPINLEIYPPARHDEGDASDTGGGGSGGAISRGRLSAALAGDFKGLATALGRLDLARLLAKGVAVRFHWKTAGRLTLTATAPAPKAKKHKARAAARKAKRIVVAKATASRSSAGTKTVRIKLTKAGRSLLRKAKSIRLTLVATFTPKGAKAVTSKRVVTVKRKKAKKRKR